MVREPAGPAVRDARNRYLERVLHRRLRTEEGLGGGADGHPLLCGAALLLPSGLPLPLQLRRDLSPPAGWSAGRGRGGRGVSLCPFRSARPLGFPALCHSAACGRSLRLLIVRAGGDARFEAAGWAAFEGIVDFEGALGEDGAPLSGRLSPPLCGILV